MKKALDQTVRELKREVNKKVLKVPGIEQKILDATSNEPWGPHGQLLMDIAQATRNYHEYQMIMNVIWKRINDIGKNWRHVYKALIVLDYLVAHGSERVIDEIKEHVYQISTLSDFQYIDSSGRDQGSNVRRKCQSLVALVNDKERIQEVRQKALANKDKYRSPYSTSGTYRSSPSSGKGGYGDRYDDERFEDRYGNKDVVRNGYGRERDWTHQNDDYGRGGDSYNRDGDLYGRDSDERYGRGSYRGDDYRGGRGNDDQFESRDRNTDRDRNSDRDRARSFDDDDRYSSRSGGGRADDASQEERQPERKLSEQNAGAPPSYEEVIRDAHNHVRTERDGVTLAAPGPKVFLSSASKSGSPSESTIQGSNHVVADVSVSTQSKEVNDFDEFDPRGSVSAAPPAASTSEMDFFGTDPINSLALVPVTSATYSSEADIPTNSGFGTNFVALSSASTTWSQASEDPFGETPFKAAPQGNFPAQQQNFAPATSFQPPSGSVGGAEPIATIPSFDFGDSLGGLTYTPSVLDGQHSSVNPAFFAPELQPIPPQFGAAALASSQGTQPAAQTYLQTANMSLLSQSGPSAPLGPQASLHSPYGTQPVAPANFSTTPMNILQQSGLSAPATSQAALTTSAGPSARPSKDKLEPKSAVWADTLSRGLVNLDISGAKINPLADIGIDFESINRMEKRKEKKSSAAPLTSTITMGRAMGSGSGIGHAGASGLAPSPNPMGSGMGMGGGAGMGMGMGMGGYGGRMNQQPMGMGMGMNMNMGMGMGMNMAMGQGAPMRSPTGVPASGQGMNGVGYNPMMGMGGYSSQQQYAGGYR